MKNILITGINGFLGSHLAYALSERYTVVGLEKSLDNLFRIKDANFVIHSAAESLEKIFTQHKIFAIIHAATLYHTKYISIEELIDTNIFLPIRLAELGNKHDVELLINTDSFFNDNKLEYSYLQEYTLSKKHCVEWLKMIAGEIKIFNMKLFHMYGPNDSKAKFVNSILDALLVDKPEIALTPGEQKRDFIYIDDVVRAYQIILELQNKFNKTFTELEVGTGIPISIKDFVTTAAELIKSKSILNFGALDYREGEIMCSKAENNILKNYGWQPSLNYKEGLQTLVSKMKR